MKTVKKNNDILYFQNEISKFQIIYYFLFVLGQYQIINCLLWPQV